MRFTKIDIELSRCTSSVQRTSWAAGLELVGDDERCVTLAGLLPVRLLAERSGLTGGIAAAMRGPDRDPDYDRGQVLVDLGLTLLAGGQAIGDFQALAHLGKLIGPVPSTPTVWAGPGRGRRAAGRPDPAGACAGSVACGGVFSRAGPADSPGCGWPAGS